MDSVSPCSCLHRRRRGFTLVELLVTLGVIAILMAILLPALAVASRQSKSSRSLATQRELLTALTLYTESHNDVFPYMATPGDPDGPIVVNGYNISFQGYFYDQSAHWTSLIVPAFCSMPPKALEIRNNVDPRGIIRSAYFLTEAAFADPLLFENQLQRTTPSRALFRATRSREVLFPAGKGLTLDVSRGALAGEPRQHHEGYLAGFADGSARQKPASQVNPDQIVRQPMSIGAFPVLNTRHGLAGIDF